LFIPVTRFAAIEQTRCRGTGDHLIGDGNVTRTCEGCDVP
jgi:hypothetical protein